MEMKSIDLSCITGNLDEVIVMLESTNLRLIILIAMNVELGS